LTNLNFWSAKRKEYQKMKKKMRLSVGAALTAAAAFVVGMPAAARAQNLSACPVGTRGEAGQVGDSVNGVDLRSPYQICVPTIFNGILVSDLDMVPTGSGNAIASAKVKLLSEGYAVSGIGRAAWRANYWDPKREADYLVRVMDIFTQRYGKPKFVMEYGCSGGGNVGLLMSEYYPGRVDGVIATAAYTPIQMQNQWLDALFALRELIAPGSGLPVVQPRSWQDDVAAWYKVLDAAQKTPQGRARIALAATIAQYPVWIPRGPLRNDIATRQKAMYDTFRHQIEFFLKTRSLFENTAGGNPSWNVGVDYSLFYRNGYSDEKTTVSTLYSRARLSIESDLASINRATRIQPDPPAVAFWHQWPRHHNGRPEVPVLRAHTTGDPNASVAALKAYRSRAVANARYRDAYIDAAGHCTQNDAEILALVMAMRHRLETGRWDDSATPAALNRTARKLRLDAPRFVGPMLPVAYNREFWPESNVPAISPPIR
jgi:pimeloyl-ACP methyl ester carboxylesterase